MGLIGDIFGYVKVFDGEARLIGCIRFKVMGVLWASGWVECEGEDKG